MKSFYFGEVLCLLSAGFSASFGISHIRLNFATPGMRFSSHSFCTRLSEMPYFFAASPLHRYGAGDLSQVSGS